MVMSTTVLNMQEAKTHLSKHVAGLKEGDRIILCRRNRPVAEIRPISDHQNEPRPVGLGRGLAERFRGVFRSRFRTTSSTISRASPGDTCPPVMRLLLDTVTFHFGWSRAVPAFLHLPGI